jgi:hypothetical protein
MELRIREVDKGGEGNEYARGGPHRQAQGPVSLWCGPSARSGTGFFFRVIPC